MAEKADEELELPLFFLERQLIKAYVAGAGYDFHTLVNQTRGVSMVNLDDLRGQSDNDQPLPSGNLEDVNAEDPFAQLKQRELTQALANGIAGLPEKERLVISLYYYEDLNMKEIGQILGITESRVCQIHTKSVLRLRAKLKSMLER